MPEEIKEPKEIHTYVIVNEKGEESGTFHGKQPRQAALKVVNTIGKGATKEKAITFKIRQRGEKKLHIFRGYIEKVKSPENRPKWLPETINKPFVKKLGVEKPEKKPED